MTEADGLRTWHVALPLAWPELFAKAALELERLDSLLLVLSGAARGLFAVNMGLSELIGWTTESNLPLGFWNFEVMTIKIVMIAIKNAIVLNIIAPRSPDG